MRADIDELVADGARPGRAADLLPRARRHPLLGDLGARSSASSTSSPASRTSPMRPTRRRVRRLPAAVAELIVAADPDFIFLADTECCGQTAETVAARPGFADLHRGAGRQRRRSSPTTSPAGGAPGSSTSSRTIVEATAARAGRLSPVRSALSLRHRRPSPSRRCPHQRACGSGGWSARGGGGRWSPSWSGLAFGPVSPARSARSCASCSGSTPTSPPHAAHGAVGDPPAPGGARAARRRHARRLPAPAYQGVFRNPLADPYLLGAAAGAGLGRHRS